MGPGEATDRRVALEHWKSSRSYLPSTNITRGITREEGDSNRGHVRTQWPPRDETTFTLGVGYQIRIREQVLIGRRHLTRALVLMLRGAGSTVPRPPHRIH